MTTTAPHLPVMPSETAEWLAAGPGRTIVDGTFGAGGHSRLLLGAGAAVIGIDQDPEATGWAEQLSEEYGESRFEFLPGNFRNVRELLSGSRLAAAGQADGLLLDLGVSSMQLDQAERGFAFRHEGPLDMRMGSSGRSAADVVNELPAADLAALLWRYGEERHSRRIARAIREEADREPITDTARLAAVVRAAYPGGARRDHPARRTFQALRIHVNDELGALEAVLAAAGSVLTPGGRLVVISYHSLEDRIVKHTMRQDPLFSVLVKRPLRAADSEQADNPRARSARFRAFERTAE